MASRTSLLASQTLYQMSIATCFGVVVWVGFSVFQALSVTPKVDVPPETLESIAINLDQKALDALTTREQLSTNIDTLFAEIESGLPLQSPSSSPSASGPATTR